TDDDTPVVAEERAEDDRGEAVSGRVERTPAPAAVDPGSAGDGGEDPGGKLCLLLTGLAGAGAGAARFGRGRAPWAGKTGYVTIPKLFGEQTLFLMADEDSERMHRFDQPVPEGGRIEVLDDGSAVILDADGAVVATVAPPWAFDAQGRPVRTWYTVSQDGQALIQHVEPGEDAIFPIIADPEVARADSAAVKAAQKKAAREAEHQTARDGERKGELEKAKRAQTKESEARLKAAMGSDGQVEKPPKRAANGAVAGATAGALVSQGATGQPQGAVAGAASGA